jgi:lipopolysaccharide export system permease protein
VSRRLITPLDRYVAAEFARIFTVTTLGFPVLVFVIDLVDNLRKYTERQLTLKSVALSYLYWIPDTLFMVLPAAVLFATVFSIGTFTRYSEISAAKASGISFYRFIAPILFMATIAMGIDLIFAELAPPANAERLKLLAGKGQDRDNNRYNFAFASETGRVYRIYTLDVKQRLLENVELEERGSVKQPGLLVAARTAAWGGDRGWVLKSGLMHVVLSDSTDRAVAFDSLVDRQFTESPRDLQATERQPSEMNFADLTRFITALERSGADVNLLRVERMLKLAGVSVSELKTTEGILKAKRVFDTLGASKGPFVEKREEDGKRYGSKMEVKVEELEIVKGKGTDTVHMFKGVFRRFLSWVGRHNGGSTGGR